MAKLALTDIFTEAQALGPIASPASKDLDILRRIFYKVNLIYEEMAKRRPSVIVGRKGAGKTALLHSVYLDNRYKIIVELTAHRAFRQMVDSIERLSKGTVLVEEVSDLWELIFWHAILAEMAKLEDKQDDLAMIRNYLSAIGLAKIQSPYAFIERLVDLLKKHGEAENIGAISAFFGETEFNGCTYDQVRSAAIDFIERNDMRAIVLLDALEDFRLDDRTMCHAISGLLRCQGSFRFPGSPCELRCCIPSELYHRLMELSSNPNKDFQHRVIVHWHASELVPLAAARYMAFLELCHPQTHSRFSHLKLDKRSDAVQLWTSVLPSTINNRIGLVEKPLAYILRHTQLLPRHFIMYLNHIYQKNRREGNSPDNFTAKSIVDGVYDMEDTILKDILSGYRYVYPGAWQACERCIPYLHLYFSDGDLHRVYNMRGTKVDGILEYDD